MVTIRRRGLEFDLETKSPRGETISTVVMSEDDVAALLADAGDEVGAFDAAYDDGYRAGYKHGQEDA
jgi:hypothetical protein